jgi:hypothetical protein
LRGNSFKEWQGAIKGERFYDLSVGNCCFLKVDGSFHPAEPLLDSEIDVAEEGYAGALTKVSSPLSLALSLHDKIPLAVYFIGGRRHPHSCANHRHHAILSQPFQFRAGLPEPRIDAGWSGQVGSDADDVVLILVGDVQKGAILPIFAHEEQSDAAASKLQAENAHVDLLLPEGNVIAPIIALNLSWRRSSLASANGPLATDAYSNPFQFVIQQNIPSQQPRTGGGVSVGQADVDESISN